MCGSAVIYINCVTHLGNCLKIIRTNLSTTINLENIRHLLSLYNLLIHASEQLDDYFGFQIIAIILWSFLACAAPAFFFIQARVTCWVFCSYRIGLVTFSSILLYFMIDACQSASNEVMQSCFGLEQVFSFLCFSDYKDKEMNRRNDKPPHFDFRNYVVFIERPNFSPRTTKRLNLEYYTIDETLTLQLPHMIFQAEKFSKLLSTCAFQDRSEKLLTSVSTFLVGHF